jgi:restriction system protein
MTKVEPVIQPQPMPQPVQARSGGNRQDVTPAVPGADGGIDLILTKPGQHGGEKFLVQCKQWRAFKVGVTVVRELYGVMAAQGAAGGFVVTSGRFTDEAISFASGRNVKLIDGTQLHQILKSARAATQGPTIASSPPRRPEPEDAQTSTCPLCSKSMVRRIAKRGANAGSAFWGCTGYPTCRGAKVLS